MGLWICLGAWPEDGVDKQYTVALEPTTSNTDSLALADGYGAARRLDARERYRWKLEFQLVGGSTSVNFNDFCVSAKLTHPL